MFEREELKTSTITGASKSTGVTKQLDPVKVDFINGDF
jgi:hypothetical protein